MGLDEVMSGNTKDSFSSDEIAKEWKDSIKRKKSYMMMGIYGLEGTAKSGVALDALSPKEVEDGWKVGVIDIDDSCEKIWEDCMQCPDYVRIINPLVTDEEDIDYVATYNHIVSFLAWFKKNAEKEKIKWVVVDGIDTLLKWCEFKMKVEYHGGEMAENKEIQYDWGKRNQMYYKVIRLLKSIPANVIITAHMSSETYFEEDSKGRKQMVTEVSGANWHKGKQQSTADELFEIVHMRKENPKKSGIYKSQKYTGEVEKWKGNARMENKKCLVLETKMNTETNMNEMIEWHGLIHKLIDENEKEKQRALNPKEKKKTSVDDLMGTKEDDSTKKLKTKDRKKDTTKTKDNPPKEETEKDNDENTKTMNESSIDEVLDVDISEELDESGDEDEDEEKLDEEKVKEDKEWLESIF